MILKSKSGTFSEESPSYMYVFHMCESSNVPVGYYDVLFSLLRKRVFHTL